ncbi:tripartite motif-containing 7-like [Pelobates cultripes]|uniref:Tripartite motif-containing 7-like n=1 Tax=Pelobates cultripes TaxID=61616 RepID=A0AAD1TD27_PELCU|nr:tripartite motif-containing 7-like [Pelobates cultripes]
MASADIRDELTCSICLCIYTDPVTLPCGHSYCRVCIETVLDTHKDHKLMCPECRQTFNRQPELKRNLRLCNIVQHFSDEPVNKKVGIACNYCVHLPRSAVKTCLLCETSMCETHLKVHCQSAEHVLHEPTTSYENRKCAIHAKVLEYYCSEDAACLCVYCTMAEEHKGHTVETLDEASEKKREILRHVLVTMSSKRCDHTKGIQSLQERRCEVQVKSVREMERVSKLVRNIREQLEAIETQILGEISSKEEQVLEQIRQLETKNEELSSRMGYVKELFYTSDPLTILQQWKSGCLDVQDKKSDARMINTVGDLDMGLILATLQRGLALAAEGVKRCWSVPEVSDISLDVNSTGKNVIVSNDMKTVVGSQITRTHLGNSARLPNNCVLSTSCFSMGKHYWEMEVSNSGNWIAGVCYPSKDCKGLKSNTGKSWTLAKFTSKYVVRHDRRAIYLTSRPSCQRLAIYLDYEAGRLSFCELSDPVRCLHTFTATFTEPLHLLLYVYGNVWVRIIG